jgi:iron(III) transport system ATP-binding protein
MVLRLHKEETCIRETEAAHVSLKNLTKAFNANVRAVFELTMEVKKGEFLSLLGPSGCGKTTILRLIAGLEMPDKGIIRIGDKIVAGKEWIQPEKRKIGLVFQDYALFPHMTIFKNIAFGLTGCAKNELKQKVMELLKMVGLPDIAERYPHELSGGQQQRVALARAMAPSPEVMLLDEPFSNLDADLRHELRTETKRILKEKGTTTILVTHDQEEAFSLSDRVGVLNKGRLEQVGAPDEIYHKPATRFVANFVGRADFVNGRIEGNSIISDIGIFKCNGTIPCDAVDVDSGKKQALLERQQDILTETKVSNVVDLMIRPDDVDFIIDPNGNASIVEAEFLGAEIIYKIFLSSGRIIHSIRPSTKIFNVGSKVSITVDPAHIVIFKKDERR